MMMRDHHHLLPVNPLPRGIEILRSLLTLPRLSLGPLPPMLDRLALLLLVNPLRIDLLSTLLLFVLPARPLIRLKLLLFPTPLVVEVAASLLVRDLVPGSLADLHVERFLLPRQDVRTR
jgi:hypothetical protein